MTPEPEIVKITADGRLIDSDSYERTIRRARMARLPAGFYVVTWPEYVERPRYDEFARFGGPYISYEQALATLAAADASSLDRTVS